MNPYQTQNQRPAAAQNTGNNAAAGSRPNDGQGTVRAQETGGESSWMQNPALNGISPAKLQMLASLASQAQGKNQNELLPFLMAAASQSKSSQMSFNSDEIDAIIGVLKLGKSPQEIQQIDRMCALVKQFRHMM